MAGFTTKQFDTLVADMVAYVIAHSNKITDMTPGSVIRSFVEGAALSMEELYIGVYLGFRRYLDTIQETAFGFNKKDGTKATVSVIFSRTATNGSVTIPLGTRIKTSSGIRFLTTVEGTIESGNVDSGNIPCEAEKIGTAYNIGPSALSILEDAITGIDTTTNALAATGGVDRESDVAFKARFQAYIEGLGRSNLAGLTAGALSVDEISSVSIVELFPPVNNVNVDLYVDNGSVVPLSAEKIIEVQTVIDGDGTEENPGYRSAGVNVVVKTPSILSQDVTMTVYVVEGIDTDQLRTDVINDISEYVNTLGIGKDIIYNELIAAIMGVYGVRDVDLTIPTDNVFVSETQVGRIGAIYISIV